MINEFIENERQRLGLIELHRNIEKEDVYQSMKNIAKEVAMVFKEEESNYIESEWEQGYDEKVVKTNQLADQIINEVSE